MHNEIKASLDALMAGIAAGNGSVIVTEMAHLDGFLATGRGALPPRLVHFLENRSYAKAQLFLSGDDNIPVGVCGGKH